MSALDQNNLTRRLEDLDRLIDEVQSGPESLTGIGSGPLTDLDPDALIARLESLAERDHVPILRATLGILATLNRMAFDALCRRLLLTTEHTRTLVEVMCEHQHPVLSLLPTWLRHSSGNHITMVTHTWGIHDIDGLLAALKSLRREKSWADRAALVQGLGRIGAHEAHRWDEPDRGRRLDALWGHLLDMRGDICDQVRARVLGASHLCGSPLAGVLIREAMTDGSWQVRAEAAALAGVRADREALPQLCALVGDVDETVRMSTLQALEQIDPQTSLEMARKCIGDDNTNIAAYACRLVGERGSPARDIGPLMRQARKNRTQAADALRALQRLDPQAAVRAACEALSLNLAQINSAVMTILRQHLEPDALGDALIEACGRISVTAMAGALEELKAQDRLLDGLRRLVEHPQAEVRKQAAWWMGRNKPEGCAELLALLVHDAAPEVRAAALGAMEREEAQRQAPGMLGDAHAIVRSAAALALKDAALSPHLLDALLNLTRDTSADVRASALKAVAGSDDPRVISELVSSINDVDDHVSNTAMALLHDGVAAVPALARFQSARGARVPVWETLRRRVEALNQWASLMGQELLGRPVVVHQYRQGLGRTHAAAPGAGPVEIEVSDTPITSGHPHGEEIMMGLALHEIGHHLCDIGVRGHSTMRGKAASQGCKDIYDILIDERLERTLRSRRPAWGVLFDRLASYAFAQNLHRVGIETLAQLTGLGLDALVAKLRAGALPGQWVEDEGGHIREVLLRDGELLAIPGAIPPTVGFLWCLRCGFDPTTHPDPRVAQAVGLVTPELRHQSHAELFELARQIAALLEHQDGPRDRRAMAGSGMGLGGLMQRLADANMLPEGMLEEGVDIRKTPPPPTPLGDPRQKQAGGQTLNLGPELDYPTMGKELTLAADPAAQAALSARVRRHVRRLRAFLERLGVREREEFASRRGRRLDLVQARKAAWSPQPDMLIHREVELAPDAYIGVLIDRSGSMSGERLQRAQAFGALVADSARGLRGIEGHVNAFDDDTFFHLGSFQHHAISALTSGGGNNDAGGLERAARLALASPRRNKVLIMISDGSPSHCTFEALKRLVTHLTGTRGIICAQVAVATIEHVAFPHFVDLTSHGEDEAVARFGNLLMKLTQHWR